MPPIAAGGFITTGGRGAIVGVAPAPAAAGGGTLGAALPASAGGGDMVAVEVPTPALPDVLTTGAVVPLPAADAVGLTGARISEPAADGCWGSAPQPLHNKRDVNTVDAVGQAIARISGPPPDDLGAVSHSFAEYHAFEASTAATAI